jgi:hypothetical protein
MANNLVLDRKLFLDWYFNGISFNDNVYVALLNDGKFELNIEELLYSVVAMPEWVLVSGQHYELDDNGNVDIDNVSLKFN